MQARQRNAAGVGPEKQSAARVREGQALRCLSKREADVGRQTPASEQRWPARRKGQGARDQSRRRRGEHRSIVHRHRGSEKRKCVRLHVVNAGNAPQSGEGRGERAAISRGGTPCLATRALIAFSSRSVVRFYPTLWLFVISSAAWHTRSSGEGGETILRYP
jgi:hypothetical protein